MSTPYMVLDVPIPGVTPRPTYAVQISDDLNLIDAHDHSLNKGAPLPLIINSGLELDVNQNLGIKLDGSTLVLGALGLKLGSISGILSVGAPTAANANGLELVGNVLSSTPADSTHPGHITIGSQDIAGAKTFQNGVISDSITATVDSLIVLFSNLIAADARTDIRINSNNTRTNGLLFAVENNSAARFSIDYTGLVSTIGITNASDYHQTSGIIYSDTINSQTASTMALTDTIVDGALSVAFSLNSLNAFSTPGAKLLSVQNNLVEKFYVDYSGLISTIGITNSSDYHQTAGTFYSDTLYSQSAVPLALTGSIADGGAAVAFSLNSLNTFSTPGAKLLSVQNNLVEKFYVDYTGLISTIGITNASDYHQTAGTFYSNTLYSQSAITLALTGTIIDGGASVVFSLNSLNALATPGAKLLSIQNNLVEKFYVDYAGLISTIGITNASDYHQTAGTFYSNTLYSQSAITLAATGTVADGGAAVAFSLNSLNAFSTPGAKLLSIQNNLVEKFYVDYSGLISAIGITNASDYHQTAGTFYSNTLYSQSAITLAATGTVADGGAAVAFSLNSLNAFSTPGAKLLSIQNNLVEKFYVDYSGLISAIGITNASDYHQTAGTFYSNTLYSQSAVTLALTGTVADGGAAVAFSLNSLNAFSTPGAKLLSVQNNLVEKFYVDYTGLISTIGITNASNYHQTAGTFYSNTLYSQSAVPLALTSSVPDSGTAVAFILDTSVDLVTINSKLFSIKSLGVEKASIDNGGGLTVNGIVANGIRSVGLATPATAVHTLGVGTLGAGTYYYRITAFNAAGNTIPNAETSFTITAPQAPAGINVNWGAVANARGYRIYGRATGAELRLITIASGTTTTWLDDGSLTPSGALPTAGIQTLSLVGTSPFDGYYIYASLSGTTHRFSVDSAGLILSSGGVVSTKIVPGQATDSPANAGSTTPNAATGNSFIYTATGAVASFTVNAPTNPTAGATGQPITFVIKNASGGVLTVSWDAVFKMAAWVDAADGFKASITFLYDGANWNEINRSLTTIPN